MVHPFRKSTNFKNALLAYTHGNNEVNEPNYDCPDDDMEADVYDLYGKVSRFVLS